MYQSSSWWCLGETLPRLACSSNVNMLRWECARVYAPQRHMRMIVDLSVMRTFSLNRTINLSQRRDSFWNRTHTLHNAPATSGSKGFDCEIFAFFHLSLVIVLNQQYRLPAMYLVFVYRVTTKIFDCLDYKTSALLTKTWRRRNIWSNLGMSCRRPRLRKIPSSPG